MPVLPGTLGFGRTAGGVNLPIEVGGDGAIDGSLGVAGDEYVNTVLVDGAIGYWRLNESAGPTATDSSSGGNNGTYQGTPTFGVPGPLATGATAVQGDLTDFYISMGNVAGLNILGNFTLEAWCANSDAINVPVLLGKWTGVHGYIYALSQGRPLLIVKKLDGTTIINEQCSQAYTDGLEHHFVATYDGATAVFYVDGAVIHSVAATGTPNANDGSFNISNFNNSVVPNNNLLAGVISNVAVYRTALTAAQVANHYALRTQTVISPGPKPLNLLHGRHAGVNVPLRVDASGKLNITW